MILYKVFGISTDYVKSIPQGILKVHAPNGVVTGAKFNEQPMWFRAEERRVREGVEAK